MCNFITEFGVIFIFAKIEGCGQKNIREIKILFDNSLIVSGVYMPYGKSCLGIIEGCGQKNLAATAKSVKNVPKFVSLETKLHLERRGEPVIG